jgi:hypothetical protein
MSSRSIGWLATMQIFAEQASMGRLLDPVLTAS